MSIALVTKLLATGLLAWFACLFALIMVRALRGDIRVSGMLGQRGGDVQPERVLNMAVFPVVVGYYLIKALNVDVSVEPSLPDIPQTLLVALTGSNSLYLAGKIARG